MAIWTLVLSRCTPFCVEHIGYWMCGRFEGSLDYWRQREKEETIGADNHPKMKIDQRSFLCLWITMANITIDLLNKKLPVDFALNLVLLTNYKRSIVMLAVVAKNRIKNKVGKPTI